jgi:triacylglycerol lipase
MVAYITRAFLLLQCILIIGLGIFLSDKWPLPLGISMLLVFLCLVILRCSLICLGFYLHYPQQTALAHPVRLSLPAHISMLAQECRMSLWSTSWTMPFCRIPTQHFPNSTTLPVLLLHGYGCNAGFWYATHQRLNQCTISHAAIDLSPVFGSIDAPLDAVHEAVKQLLQSSGQSQLILVGHSMGGLVARSYLRKFGTHQIAKVITLGTPHHGTLLAKLGIGENCKEMQCTKIDGTLSESDWLRSLATSENLPKRALLTSIYSLHDNIIAPQTSSHLDGAKHYVFTGIGHMTLCQHDAVGQLLIREIRQT